MLTHKEIKRLVMLERKRAVKKGMVWVGDAQIGRAKEELRRTTAEMSLDELHAEEDKIEQLLAETQDRLTNLAVEIEKREIERLQVGDKPKAWIKALLDYVSNYNQWKTQKALMIEIRRIIQEPLVNQHSVAGSRGVGKGHERFGVKSQPSRGKQEPIDLTAGISLNEFIQSGEGWLITYGGGRRLVLKHRKGLLYIAHLLSRPNERVHCDELLSLDRNLGAKAGISDDIPDDEFSEKSAVDGTSESGVSVHYRDGMVEVADGAARAQYRKRRAVITRILADPNISKSRHSELQNEDEMLEKLLFRSAKRFGEMSANDKNKMNSVAKAINDSIKAIADAEEEQVPQSQYLADHLRSSINKGMSPSYCPAPNIDWRVETKPR